MTKISPNKVDYIIAHANCPDGFGAAWSAWKLLKKKAHYHFANHGHEPPFVRGKNVAILDFCYDIDAMSVISKEANRVIVLDHHKSAMANMKDAFFHNVEFHFDMNRSGAKMAWDFFHPNKVSPTIIDYIQDRDLWLWKMPKAKEYLAALDSYQWSFKKFDEISGKNFKSLVAEGEHIVRYYDRLIANAVEQADRGLLKTKNGNIKVWFVNVNARELVSDVGNAIARLSDDRDVGVVWYYDGNGFKVSLRSVKTDVSEVAARFTGGGGHHNAAGFSYPGTDLSNLIISE